MTYQVVVPGKARGETLLLGEPLSFWGGFDPATGKVIDASHPQLGQRLSGMVVVMHSGRGSSSASTVLAEAMRRGTAPAALILSQIDPILVIGSLVGNHLYQVSCPIVLGPRPAAGAQLVVDGHKAWFDGPPA